MSKTLLQICQAALGRAGLGKENQFFGANDETMAHLANESLHDLKREFPWQIMRRTGTVSMTSETAYDLPTDILYIIPDTMNADGQLRPINFPTDDSTWWYFKANEASGVRYRVRIVNGSIEVLNPDSGIDLIFEYLTENVINADPENSKTPIAEWERDTDTCVLDDELLIKDLKWRYKAEKGIEGWEKDKMIFNDYLRKLKGQEQGARSLNFGGGPEAETGEPYTPLYI